jgi:cobalamin-dependent methionine synthase I
MTLLRFGIEQLTNYINWIYFYHTWGIKESNASEIRLEADSILKKWCTEKKEVLFGVYIALANSSGEDIILHQEQEDGLLTIPLLRQQHPPFLCLSDFLPPTCMHAEKIGVFASTVPFQVEGLLEQTLADRLAEAAAELGHEIVRKQIWAYAPDEKLSIQELFAEHYQGKRPAVGYPSLPDQSINFILSSLLDFPSLGISLTENGAMIPHASTTGLMISHPQCRHFKVGTIGEDQLADYASRRGMTPDTIRKFIDIA